jgi:hypothetical protein
MPQPGEDVDEIVRDIGACFAVVETAMQHVDICVAYLRDELARAERERDSWRALALSNIKRRMAGNRREAGSNEAEAHAGSR